MLNTLAAQIDITPASGLLADLSNQLSYVRTDVRGLDLENDLTATANANAGVGGVASYCTPPNVAFAVSKKSGLTGRSARGRVYLAGFPVNGAYLFSSSSHQLTVAAAEAYRIHVDGFRNVINLLGVWDAVIVSRFNNGAKRTVAVTFPWTATTIHDRYLDTQRKRAM